jgi:hypothetical protein
MIIHTALLQDSWNTHISDGVTLDFDVNSDIISAYLSDEDHKVITFERRVFEDILRIATRSKKARLTVPIVEDTWQHFEGDSVAVSFDEAYDHFCLEIKQSREPDEHDSRDWSERELTMCREDVLNVLITSEVIGS